MFCSLWITPQTITHTPECFTEHKFIVTILINMFSLLIQKRKIFQVTVLGEMDKAESSYEAMCFVTELVEDEFISSDAMSKLRQVNSTLSIIIIIVTITKFSNLIGYQLP